MLSRVYGMVAAFAVATLLGVGGFAGYLAGSGHLTGPRAELIAAVLRGELDDWKAGESHEAEEHAETQPAESEAHAPGHAPAAEAAEAREKAETLEAMRLERAESDLLARQRLLEQVLTDVRSAHETLEREQKDKESKRDASESMAASEGFKRELDYLASLKPALAKEHLLRVWSQSKDDAVRIMVNIDEGRGKRILEQFKTPEELQIMTELLEQIRESGGSTVAEKSGTTAGATP